MTARRGGLGLGLVNSVFVSILGLVIGSFLNVVIYRVPRGESLVRPGSHCPACGHFLKPWELIPVFSFLIQRGRCRRCQTRISWRYPLVELLTGLLFFYTYWHNPGTHPGRLALDLVFIASLVALTFIDLDTMRLPDVIVLPLVLVGLAGAWLIPDRLTGWESLASAVGAGGLFWFIARVYPEGMGLGDVKLVAALGAFLGFPGIILAVFLASLSGSLIGLARLFMRRASWRQQIPFGPYLAFGGVVTLLWGNTMWFGYWAWAYH